MQELISHPGFSFYILRLEGTLKFSNSRNGKQARKFEISDADLDDSGVHVKEEDDPSLPIPSGNDVSAVGLQLRLIKNDSLLSMEFNDKSGGSACWTFEGLDETSEGLIHATAEIQTEPVQIAEITMESSAATKTSVPIAQTTGLHTAALDVSDAGIQVDVSELSRKRRSSDQGAQPNKRARPTADSAAWPNHLFMEGYRVRPKSTGGVGTLHIDLKTSSIWYASTFGKKHNTKKHKEQVDIHDENIIVRYGPTEQREKGFTLTLYRKLWKAGEETEYVLFEMTTDPTMHRMWSYNFKFANHESPIVDPAVIIDAIVHCIDRTSNRKPPVHDPEAAASNQSKIQDCNAYLEIHGTLPTADIFGPSREQLDKHVRKEELRMERYEKMRQYIIVPSTSELQDSDVDESLYGTQGSEASVEAVLPTAENLTPKA